MLRRSFFVSELAEGGDFDLGDAGEGALDGVFQGDEADAGLGGGDVGEEGVDGSGFAGAGRAVEDQHAGFGGGGEARAAPARTGAGRPRSWRIAGWM